ncbi:MAG: pseudouridine synthase [Culicoidibacterales bacterium]
MRLDKMLSHGGFGTRREVKILVRQKRVKVNGTTIKKGDMQINETKDIVTVDGNSCNYQEFIYVMMHKKLDVVSAREDKLHQTVFDDLPHLYYDRKLAPVGRLDKDATGLLLLTNDGKLAHELLLPKNHVDKVYRVIINKPLTPEMIDLLETGVTFLDGHVCMPAKVEVTDELNMIFLTIQEGKFHQVKKMLLAVGNEVLALKRVQMGNLLLDEEIPVGGYRELTDEELDKLNEIRRPNH